MKRIATLAAIAGAAAVAIAPVPASAESAELRITGTIVPAACTPAFAGGGVVDYGTIPASSLNPTAQTTLAQKSIQLTMTCDAPVRFGFKVIDERAASAVTSLETIQGATPNMKFGLGTSDGKNIGAYSLQVVRETVNGGGFSIALESGDGGISWGFLNQRGLWADGSKLVSFSNTSSNQPGANTSVTADIRVTTAIDKSSNLPLTHAIPLDGLSTFELIYL
ncbi:DUF1120 domain-containing protein [Variovorax boronicumulans]|uniref:DUF1120 domain-containing protein n=1 Tax=Variovorax boronicumulans TaxID=436515 RepID=UPI0007866DC6|nr:DUF1120 domain-containing protein [Variovorax boronicumulans]